MAVTDDRKYSKAFAYNLLEGVKGKTLGEVDKSHQNKLYYFMPYIIKGKGVRDLYFVKIA